MKANETPSSSSNSTTTMDERDSCYFPGCRKDANCTCEICIASINATLDLVQKSSLTKLSSSRPNVQRTPVSFTPILSTPKSGFRPQLESPDLKSTARGEFGKKLEVKRKREWGYEGDCLRVLLGLGLLFAVEIGFSWGFFKPVLSFDRVGEIGGKSRVLQDFGGKLMFLESELKGVVGDNGKVSVSNCSHVESLWRIDQDGLLLSSRCVLYKSTMEELSVWGWPLQTAGMIKTGFSSKSFTVLSGRVAEWSNGATEYTIRKANSSWICSKWGASVVQLDPNTWILEYRRSSVLDSSSLSSVMAEVFKHWMVKVGRRLRQETGWLFSVIEGFSELNVNHHGKIPT